MEDFLQLETELKKVLKQKRYEHTLGVRYTAASMAMRYGYDIRKAELAGLLHDCAKGFSEEELLAMAEKHEIVVTPSERKAPYLLHAKVGAFLAEHTYGVTDEEVLEAIRYHTTGKPDMTLLEKIIFIADYIEPNRKMIEGLSESRRLAFEDLDQAMYHILANTLAYLQKKNDSDSIDATTKSAYEYYRNKTNKS